MSDYNVALYCDDPHHERKVHHDVLSRRDGQWYSSNRRIKHLLGDHVLSARELASLPADHLPRAHYTLRCRCGLEIRARMETLAPKLDQLAAGGIAKLSLGTLIGLDLRTHKFRTM